MRFNSPLIKGRLLKRYKRFFADVELETGEFVVAHVPNTGSLKGCLEPGQDCLLSPATAPERKLRYTLELIKAPSSWVGVNTGQPNKLVKELFESQKYSRWKDYKNLKLEIKIDKGTRMDGVLHNLSSQDGDKITMESFKKEPAHFLEFKNVTMMSAMAPTALFPDGVTERGQKHLQVLMELVKQGHKAEIVFVIQRSDVTSFQPAVEIDPNYATLLAKANKAGVIITPMRCMISESELSLDPKSGVRLEL